MHYDRKRGLYVLQSRQVLSGLTVLSVVIALGLVTSFSIPESEPPLRYVLWAIVLFLAFLAIKINFSVLLSVHVELTPSGRLIFRSQFNREEVGEKARAVELSERSLVLVMDEDVRHTLFEWLPSADEQRYWLGQARRIARALNVPLKSVESGQSRRVTKPSALRFRSLAERIETPPPASACDALTEAAGRCGAQLEQAEGQLELRWLPERPAARALWTLAGLLGAAGLGAELLGWVKMLTTNQAALGVTSGLVGVWIYLGAYVFMAREALRVADGQLEHGLTGLARVLCFPLATTTRIPLEELEEIWVFAETPGLMVIESQHEPLMLQSAPLPSTELAGALLRRALGH